MIVEVIGHPDRIPRAKPSDTVRLLKVRHTFLDEETGELIKSDKQRINTISDMSSALEKITQSSSHSTVITALFDFEQAKTKILASPDVVLTPATFEELLSRIKKADKTRGVLIHKASELKYERDSGFYVLGKIHGVLEEMPLITRDIVDCIIRSVVSRFIYYILLFLNNPLSFIILAMPHLHIIKFSNCHPQLFFSDSRYKNKNGRET